MITCILGRAGRKSGGDAAPLVKTGVGPTMNPVDTADRGGTERPDLQATQQVTQPKLENLLTALYEIENRPYTWTVLFGNGGDKTSHQLSTEVQRAQGDIINYAVKGSLDERIVHTYEFHYRNKTPSDSGSSTDETDRRIDEGMDKVNKYLESRRSVENALSVLRGATEQKLALDDFLANIKTLEQNSSDGPTYEVDVAYVHSLAEELYGLVGPMVLRFSSDECKQKFSNLKSALDALGASNAKQPYTGLLRAEVAATALYIEYLMKQKQASHEQPSFSS